MADRPILACIGAVDDTRLAFVAWNLAGAVADDDRTVLLIDLTGGGTLADSGTLTRIALDRATCIELAGRADVSGVHAWLLGRVDPDDLREPTRGVWLLPAAPAVSSDVIGRASTDTLRDGIRRLMAETDADAAILVTRTRHRAHLVSLIELTDAMFVVASPDAPGVRDLRRLGDELAHGVPTSTTRVAGYIELAETAPLIPSSDTNWSRALPAVFRDAVVLDRGEELGRESVHDPLSLGRLMHRLDLLDAARKARQPISRLSAADGLDALLIKAAHRQSQILRTTAGRLRLLPGAVDAAPRPRAHPTEPTHRTRYWLPAEGAPRDGLVSGGFLIDPESWEGRYRASALFDQTDLDRLPSVVLLGEPGIGKTTAIEAWAAQRPGPLVRGADIDDREDLRRALTSSGEGGPLYVDALDESRLFRENPRRFLTALGKALEDAPRQALRLTCRTSFFSPMIRDALDHRVPSIRVGAAQHRAFVMMPLTRADVQAHAAARLEDPDAWLDTIARLHLGPSAAHPFTLRRLYLPDGQPPAPLDSTPWDLHERAAETLCAFPRHDALDQPPPTSTVGERLDVASFVAFARVMTGRAFFVAHPGDTAALNLDALADAGPFGRAALRETLRCPLFAGGPDGWRFVHESFADFLAARYAAEHLEPARVWGAVCNARGRVPEPLFEMMLWLGQRTKWIAHRLREDAPLRVLEHRGFLDDDARRGVLAQLVARHRRGDLDLAVEYAALSQLAGPGIEAEVEALLDDDDDQLVEAAVDLIRYRGQPLAPTRLVALACDRDRSLTARTAALDALAATRADFDPAAVRALLPDPDGEDLPGAGYYARDLVAAALRLLWPDHLTVDTLLAHLRPPRGLGRWRYDWQRLADSFSPDELPVALHWALDDIERNDYLSDLEHFADSLAMRCWALLTPGPMLTALARAVQLRGLEIDWASHPERRGLVLRALLTHPQSRRWAWHNVYAVGLLRPADAPYVLEEALAAEGDEHTLWVSMLCQIFRRPDHDELIERASALPGFADHVEAYDRTLAGELDPAPYIEQHRAIAERRRLPPRPPAPPRPSVEEALALIEREPERGWLALDTAMTHRAGDQLWTQDPETLRALPQELRSALWKHIRAIFDEPPPQPSDPLTPRQQITLEVLSTSMADASSADALNADLSVEQWDRWIPTLVTHDKAGALRGLNLVAARARPASWGQAWVSRYRTVARGWASTEDMRPLRELVELGERVTPSALLPAAEALLHDETLSPTQRVPVLRVLLAAHRPAAVPWARAHFDETTVAYTYLSVLPEEAWPQTWDRIQREPTWGKQLWREGAPFERGLDFAHRLPASSRAELAWWLLDHCQATRVPEGQSFSMSRDDWLIHIAAQLIETMVRAGEEDGIRRLIELDPKPHWRQRLERAQRNADARDWVPFEPTYLSDLVQPPRTARELADAVLRGLRLIQDELLDGEHAEPASFWDRVGKERRPKSEDDLSYWLRNRLAERLPDNLSLDRETDVAGGQARTDIRVRLTTPGASATLIIEAKGCWHPELLTSAREQLVARYLARLPDASGILLAWWFDRASWSDESDSRRRGVKKAHRHSAQPLADALAREAETLAAETGRDVRSFVFRVSKAPPPLTANETE